MGKVRTIRRWAIGLVVPAIFGAAIAFAVLTDGDGLDERRIAAAPTAAEARALGARWRANGGDELGVAYAQALVAAGLYDELLSEISERGLFARDTASATLFRTEATLRQGRYAEALDAGGEGSAFDNPYLAYARARAAYALTGDPVSANADLARALRGPAALAADAWMFRARLALDANDARTAGAALRRAGEAGAARAAIDVMSIEALIRQGRFDVARERLSERARKARRKSGPGDATHEAEALAAMLCLRAGDWRCAVGVVDDARMASSTDVRDRLITALAKWMNGDLAQSYALLEGVLAAAPENWIALDLAAVVARDLGRMADADAFLDRLAVRRPALAQFRRRQIADLSEDETLRSFAAGAGDPSLGGAAAALVGGDDHLPAAISEPDASARKLAALATAIRANVPRAMRKQALDLIEHERGPVALALAGAALQRVGDGDRAQDVFARASSLAPDFFAPVRARAEMFALENNRAAAIGLLREFLAGNARHAEARLAMAILEAEGGAHRAACQSFASLPPALVFADERAGILYARAAHAMGAAATTRMLAAARDAQPSLVALGAIHSEVGDDAGAAAMLRRALIADPTDEEAPGLYLAAMTRMDRADEARSLLVEIVRQRPEAVAVAAVLDLAQAEEPRRF